jgi:hypothetical protein
MRRVLVLLSVSLLLALSPPALRAARAQLGGETIDQALCRLIEGSAAKNDLPVDFLTRLIWQESSFRPHVTSPAGAQGVAQFMPGTAAERRLADPFDPEQAIPEAGRFLADLVRQFGNLGLAAAGYNGGPARVSKWLDGKGGLPAETRAYVLAITGRPVEEWVGPSGPESKPDAGSSATGCMQVASLLRRADPGQNEGAPLAHWGVQLAGNFSKSQALATYSRASLTYAAILGEVRPMIIGTRLRSRGTRAFYRVRVPASTRTAANQLCQRIRSAGGSCLVLPS